MERLKHKFGQSSISHVKNLCTERITTMSGCIDICISNYSILYDKWNYKCIVLLENQFFSLCKLQCPNI